MAGGVGDGGIHGDVTQSHAGHLGIVHCLDEHSLQALQHLQHLSPLHWPARLVDPVLLDMNRGARGRHTLAPAQPVAPSPLPRELRHRLPPRTGPVAGSACRAGWARALGKGGEIQLPRGPRPVAALAPACPVPARSAPCSAGSRRRSPPGQDRAGQGREAGGTPDACCVSSRTLPPPLCV